MGRRKRKNRKQDRNIKQLLLLTALTQLITALIDLIGRLIE